jgi:hypothetical protein
MHKATVTTCIALGVLALAGTAFFCYVAMAFDAFSHGRGTPIFILLAAGPLSLLPAGIVGRKRPLLAAVWLLGGSLFFYFWHLEVIHYQEYRGYPLPGHAFEEWLPIVLVCPVMSLLGAGFLSVGWPPARATVARWWQSPVFRRRFSIALATLLACGTVILGVRELRKPAWIITVTPEGQPSKSIRFNPRSHLEAQDGGQKMLKLEAELQGLFRPMFQLSGRDVLGKSVWTGSREGGTSVWTVQRGEKGLIRILQNSTLVDKNWMTPAPAMDCAVRAAARQVLEQAWRENMP